MQNRRNHGVIVRSEFVWRFKVEPVPRASLVWRWMERVPLPDVVMQCRDDN